MSPMFANIVTVLNDEEEEQVEEYGILNTDAEFKLTRYCNYWDDDFGVDEGPFIVYIEDPVEHKQIWLKHANAYMGSAYSGTLTYLMIDEDDFYTNYGEKGTELPIVACDEYAEKYGLNSIFDFAMGY